MTSSSKYKAKNNVHYFKKNIKHSIESNIHIKQGDVTEWFEKNLKKKKINHMLFSVQSSDKNPVENLWEIFG